MSATSEMGHYRTSAGYRGRDFPLSRFLFPVPPLAFGAIGLRRSTKKITDRARQLQVDAVDKGVESGAER